jgi:hypothetical protein
VTVQLFCHPQTHGRVVVGLSGPSWTVNSWLRTPICHPEGEETGGGVGEGSSAVGVWQPVG